MYVCMYVCVYVCMYVGVCMYVCVCVCMNACYVAGLHLVFKLRIKFQEKPEIFRFIHRQTDTNHTHTLLSKHVQIAHMTQKDLFAIFINTYMYIYIHI